MADAVESGRRDKILDELGDLLFQSVFLGRLAEEQGWFDFDDVAEAITRKLIRRHPHVFARDRAETATDAAAVAASWEAIKAEERARESATPRSQLDDIPVTLPALQRAQKTGKRAARVGFDWPTVDGVFDKLDEEIAELRTACTASTNDTPAIRAEAGDVLLTVVSLCRHLDIDAERALREANSRFAARFRELERLATSATRSAGGARRDGARRAVAAGQEDARSKA